MLPEWCDGFVASFGGNFPRYDEVLPQGHVVKSSVCFETQNLIKQSEHENPQNNEEEQVFHIF